MQQPTNIRIDQGATFALSLIWKDLNDVAKDLTGYTARMQVRPTYANNTIYMSATTGTNEITITPATGKIDILVSATVTATIPVDTTQTATPPRSSYVYDLEMVDAGGIVTRLLFGKAVVYAEVTR